MPTGTKEFMVVYGTNTTRFFAGIFHVFYLSHIIIYVYLVNSRNTFAEEAEILMKQFFVLISIDSIRQLHFGHPDRHHRCVYQWLGLLGAEQELGHWTVLWMQIYWFPLCWTGRVGHIFSVTHGFRSYRHLLFQYRRFRL